MTTYASYMPSAAPGHHRAHSYPSVSPNRHDQLPQRSPFPREGTPTPTIKGKPGISSESRYYRAGSGSPRPYQQTSQTHTWVLEQDYMRKEREKQNSKTQRWVFDQRALSSGKTLRSKDDFPSAWDEKTRSQMWEELIYSYELETDRWLRQQEEIRRQAANRERTKERYVQEELRRIDARIRAKRETERQKIVEEKLRAQMETRERERKERAGVQKAIHDAWIRYEHGWEEIVNSAASLGFKDIPWPTRVAPTSPSDITPSAIVNLLLSPFHSSKQMRKERIRSAQLRWHPDRFRRLLSRVKEEDREAVEEGVGIIARCLNDLMSREKPAVRSRSHEI